MTIADELRAFAGRMWNRKVAAVIVACADEIERSRRAYDDLAASIKAERDAETGQ